MKNKKIISLICVIAMIMSLFAGITVNAASDRGIQLTATLNDNATVLTVVAKAVGEPNGVSAADVRFNVPENIVDKDNASYVSVLEGGKEQEWDFAINDGQVKMNFFNKANLKFADDVLATVTIPLTVALDTDYTVTLGDKSTIKDSSSDPAVLTKVGTGDNDMVASTSTANNKNAKSSSTGVQPTKVTDEPSTEPQPVAPATDKKGIKLEANIDDTNTVITVIATALNEPNGVSAADIRFSVPEASVDKDNTSYASVLEGGKEQEWDFAINDGQVKMNFFNKANLKFADNVLATVTIKLTTPLSEAYAITLGDKSTIKDSSSDPAVLTKVGTGENDMVATSVVVKPTEADKGTPTVADLSDYMGKDNANNKTAAEVAAEKEADVNAGNLYLTVEVKKDNADGTAKVDATYGTDYVATYDLDGDGTAEELTKAQYENLIHGRGASGDGINAEAEKISNVIKGLKFNIYDSAKNAQIKTTLNEVGNTTQLLNDQEKTDVEPDSPSTDRFVATSIKLAKNKKQTATAGKEVSNTLTINTGSKNGEDYDFGKATFQLTEESLKILPLAGVEISFDEITLADEDTDSLSPITVTTSGKIELPESADGKYTIKFTPTGEGTVSYTVTYGDAYDGKTGSKVDDVEDYVTYTVSEKKSSSGGSGSGSSSKDKTSSGGGAIAYGLVDTGSSYIPSLGFDDLSDVEWAQAAINSLAAKKIVSGVGDNKFDPNAALTRAAYAQMLVNAIGHNEDSADVEFDDVPTDAWFYHNVAVAAQLGIVAGFGDGSFRPYDLITREQMALMTQKAAVVMSKSLVGADAGTFTDDADIADWSRDAVYQLSNAGIINGMGDGSFAPQANATRAQAAVIIYNTFVK